MDHKHFSHSHSLVFHQLPQGSEIQCSGCKSPSSGEVYVCWQCRYYLHEQCYRASPSLKHTSHTLHPLTLVPYPTHQSGSFICNSCNLVGNGFSYCCAECDLDMHVHCALVPPIIPNPYMPSAAQSYHNPLYPPVHNNVFPNYH